jgi:hypothetical protein
MLIPITISNSPLKRRPADLLKVICFTNSFHFKENIG